MGLCGSASQALSSYEYKYWYRRRRNAEAGKSLEEAEVGRSKDSALLCLFGLHHRRLSSLVVEAPKRANLI